MSNYNTCILFKLILCSRKKQAKHLYIIVITELQHKMKFRLSILSALTFFLTLTLVSFASAGVLNVTSTTIPSSVAHNAGSFTLTFTLNNTGDATTINWNSSALTSGTGNITIPTNNTMAPNVTQTFTATVPFSSFQTGNIAGIIIANNGTSNSSNFTFSVPIQLSSSLSISNPFSLSRTQNGTLNITNTGNTALTTVNFTSSGDFNINFSTNNIALAAGASSLVNTSFATSFDTLKFGTLTTTVTAKDTVNLTSTTSTLTVSKSFCNNQSIGTNLSIRSISFTSSGDSTKTWKLLDTVKIEVKIENKGTSTVSDVEVRLGLFDSSNNDKADLLSFVNKGTTKINLGDIKDADSKTATFEFKAPVDMSLGDFKLAFKAYSRTRGEDQLCTDSSSDLSNSIFQTIKIERQTTRNKFIVFDEVNLGQSEYVCGDSASITFNAYNIGDLDEPKVKVKLVGTELAVDTFVERTMDRGTRAPLSFTFNIPKNVSNKLYYLYLSSLSDFRTGDYFVTSSTQKAVPITIKGCAASVSTAKTTVITASLQSDAKAGKEMIVSTIITNSDTKSANYTITASGFESWAKLNSISNKTFTLGAGESKEITFSFDVEDDASGEETFTINSFAGDKLETKEVAVNIEKSSLFSSLASSLGENSMLWIIGAINLLLIVVIIIVAVKVARR